jgi:hypothetical protein
MPAQRKSRGLYFRVLASPRLREHPHSDTYYPEHPAALLQYKPVSVLKAVGGHPWPEVAVLALTAHQFSARGILWLCQRLSSQRQRLVTAPRLMT